MIKKDTKNQIKLRPDFFRLNIYENNSDIISLEENDEDEQEKNELLKLIKERGVQLEIFKENINKLEILKSKVNVLYEKMMSLSDNDNIE